MTATEDDEVVGIGNDVSTNALSHPLRRQCFRTGSPPITRTTIPTCRTHHPDGSKRVRVSIASPSHKALPEGGS
jgi:hypothetical protein